MIPEFFNSLVSQAIKLNLISFDSLCSVLPVSKFQAHIQLEDEKVNLKKTLSQGVRQQSGFLQYSKIDGSLCLLSRNFNRIRLADS